MSPLQHVQQWNRRLFLQSTGMQLGAAALSALSGTMLSGHNSSAASTDNQPGVPLNQGGLPGLPHHPAKAKCVIYLFQSGAPCNSSCSITNPS